MSESESDAPPPPPADDGPLFPIDGKFKSEQERARVMALPEVERESFLADRSEEIQEAAQSAQLRQLMASRAKQDSQKKRKAEEAGEELPPAEMDADDPTDAQVNGIGCYRIQTVG